uniref:fibropellin-1-like isoform X2 n=1 Tax=Ciona intestinalis TaxID=7719 RepID=UPI00089DC054|nr:fibropellin-1-like isoform X2 [Ciona intestinalis]|eukprot:XP_018671827.1 fibropellin-1-like isoform X2 [Ciona intestinalis]
MGKLGLGAFCCVFVFYFSLAPTTDGQVNRAVYNGSEILIFHTRKSYHEARLACRDIFGDLVIIRNRALQDIITPYLQQFLPNWWAEVWSWGYWIGGLRQAHANNWEWWDGTLLPQPGSVNVYQNWIGVEPNGALGLTWCAAMTPYNQISNYNNTKGGWIDDECTRKKSYVCQRGLCASRPCQNNGECIVMETEYRCNCSPGYNGINCEIDLCASNPCQNGGTCNKVPGNYTCTCLKGYSGRNCENDFCLPNRCQNNGTCVREIDDYKCKCQLAYEGKNCSIAKFQDFGNGCTIHINKIPSQMKSYEDAKIQCNSLQAELAIGKSNQSNVIINQYNQLWMDSQPLWLGGKESNSSWKWLDGSNVDGFNTSTMAHDGCLSTAVNGSWSAENCSRRLGYACEKLVNGRDLCSSTKCKNGGNCSASGCHFYCNCLPGFDGLHCEISNVQNTTGINYLVYVIPGGTIVLLAVFIISGLLCYKRRANAKRNNNDECGDETVHIEPDVYSDIPELPCSAIYENVHTIPQVALYEDLK